jgi:small GTP-binding protein
MTLNGAAADLAIWDTVGQEVYHALTPMYYRDAAMAVIVFSVADEHSLEGAARWIKEVRNAVPNALLRLVGNKIDISPPKVTPDRATEFAAEHSLEYVETSAQTGQGVTELFETMVEEYITLNKESHRLISQTNVPCTVSLTPTADPPAPSSCC